MLQSIASCAAWWGHRRSIRTQKSHRMNCLDCTQTRRLIDQGLTPGSHPPIRAALGFHLAHCPACRAYLAQHEAMAHQPPPPPEQAPSHRPPRKDWRRARQTALRRLNRLLVQTAWWAGVGVAATLLLLLLWFGSILVRAEQNIAAMVVEPAAAPVSTPSPTASNTPVAAQLVRPRDVAQGVAPTRPQAATPIATPPPRLPPPPTLTPTPIPPEHQAVHILILGNDHRPGRTILPRTDVMMLVRIDPLRQRVALLSLVRDLWVHIPDYGFERINEAYRLGAARGGTAGGLLLARRTVSHLTGVPIHYTVMVDFQGFIGLIDALGGIVVDVEKPLYDDEYPTMDDGYMVVRFDRGVQQMDGARALIYSRIRHPDSDFFRVRRQQTVLTAIGARIRQRGYLGNLLAADHITSALRDYISTDMPQEKLLYLAWVLRDYQVDQIERYALSRDMVRYGVGTDRHALLPRRAALNGLVQAFLGAP